MTQKIPEISRVLRNYLPNFGAYFELWAYFELSIVDNNGEAVAP